jgi:hypothetical protein
VTYGCCSLWFPNVKAAPRWEFGNRWANHLRCQEAATLRSPYLLGPSLVKWHNRWMDYEKNTIEPFKKRVEEHKQKQRRLEEKQQQQQSQRQGILSKS